MRKLSILIGEPELKWMNLEASADCATDWRIKKYIKTRILSTLTPPTICIAFPEAEQDVTPMPSTARLGENELLTGDVHKRRNSKKQKSSSSHSRSSSCSRQETQTGIAVKVTCDLHKSLKRKARSQTPARPVTQGCNANHKVSSVSARSTKPTLPILTPPPLGKSNEHKLKI